MTGRRLALFDFDGTITTRDTMLPFVVHVRGVLRTLAGLVWLAPMLAAHAIGLVGTERAKALFLGHFLGGWTREALAAKGVSFVPRIEGWIRSEARTRLDWHRAEGHDVLIVSASLDLWLAAWAEKYGVRLVCTEAKFDDAVFTGQLATPNCKGAAKEDRIRQAVDLDGYAYVYAYGDSSGDAEMLALADEGWFRPFRPGAPPMSR